ncbi:hypothetical protein GEU84_000010 [Fertoebacter nigrum]|uniref:Uncharacterized protein n=1 Tax=Fertoeibacter niger TaxID=2656921 RepID=A0A8X8KJ27_9RHOB|nr:hypothetical protein [Fertoeibacter niger]NUB42754.1 hypothetical protein [Fertoeibacter niger]
MRDSSCESSVVADGARVAVGDSFAALPVSVHSAAFSMLCDRRAVAADPFREEDMQRLATVPAYRALANEWGYDAPRKLAVLQERLWRVLDRQNDGDVRRAIGWLDALPTSGMVALARKLAG